MLNANVAVLLIALGTASNAILASAESDATFGAPNALRAWRPEDSVRLNYYLGDPRDNSPSITAPDQNAPIVVAPNGEHFFVVRRFGNVDRDESVYRLLLWSAASVIAALEGGASALAPLRAISMRASSQDPASMLIAIRAARFDATGENVTFIGSSANVQNVFTLSVKSGRIRQLTRSPTDVADYAVRGDRIFYFTPNAYHAPSPLNYPFHVVEDRVTNSRHVEWKAKQREVFYEAFEVRGRFRTTRITVAPYTFHRIDDLVSTDGQRLVIPNTTIHEHGAATKQDLTYRVVNGKWQIGPSAPAQLQRGPELTAAPPPLSRGLSVQLKQNGNSPPRLIASQGGRCIILADADSLLSEVWFARTQPFQWTEPDGKVQTGGLMLPRGYQRTQRIPVVIQNYYYLPEFFLPDGPHPGTTDAAQSLVARGIAVLQIDLIPSSAPGLEGPNFVERIDSIVDALIAHGVADEARIGATGFSRGGYQVSFAVTHPGRYPLAAAVVDDSVTFNYAELLFSGQPESARINGSATFWENPERWLVLDTSFNTHRVRTPALFVWSSPEKSGRVDDYPSDLIATANAYRLNNKPFEGLVFPRGLHLLYRPQEHLELQRSVVEWMAFWLKDEAPNDVARAARWKKLREQQDNVLKQAVAPKGKWIFVTGDEAKQ